MKKSRKNQKGQVAIFIALMFQVLFLFFAMVVNVGLLVHHKINLQNSVDLAAYYGAMKQAEMMNVIAHSNYQIRQSWKLLAWRYRVLGTAGVMQSVDGKYNPAHPFRKTNPHDVVSGISSTDADWAKGKIGLSEFYDAPPFCITFIPFKPMPPDESTCKYADLNDNVKLPVTPTNSFFTSITHEAYKITNYGKAQAEKRCKVFGSINYGTLGRFISAYAYDQAQRKMLISALSRNMSKDPELDHDNNFLDIDGNPIRSGIEKTLRNNLTDANRNALDNGVFKVYNSLADSHCSLRTSSKLPAKWLTEIRVSPGFAYKDTYCSKNEIKTKTKLISDEASAGSQSGSDGTVKANSGPPEHCKPGSCDPDVGSELAKLVTRVHDVIEAFVPIPKGDNTYPYNASIGFEKDPWCEVYVGVRATVSPKVPFSIGSTQISARAFAKPFGGKIGPWYGTKFSKDMNEENAMSAGDVMHEFMPSRVLDAATQSPGLNVKRIANYQRFPGDETGLRSAKVLGFYAKALYQMDKNWKGATNQNYNNAAFEDAYPGTYPNFNDWNEIEMNFVDRGKDWDILAWDSVGKFNNPMRKMEISAISPDIYDIANYSIEPNFYAMYGKRLESSMNKIESSYLQNYPIRGDLGARNGNDNYNSSNGGNSKSGRYFNVKDQIETTAGILKGMTISPDNGALSEAKFDYPINNFAHTLTSWTSFDYLDYGFDKVKDTKFGQCDPKSIIKDGDIPAPGNCLNGGRTGYSVKLVSQDFLNSDKQFAGDKDSGKDQIKNPPPADF